MSTERKLSDPLALAQAVVMQVVVGKDAGRLAVSYITEDITRSDVAFLYSHGVDVFDPTALSELTVTQLFEHAKIPVEYKERLLANNIAFIAAYGNAADNIKVVTEPVTLYSIDQADIPSVISDVVESTWTMLLDVNLLPGIAAELRDPSVTVDRDAYVVVERGIITAVEHPQQEALFLKLLRKRGTTNPILGHWLKQMGL